MFFICFNNPRHITTSDVRFISITISSIPSIPTLYHTPIKLSTVCSFGSIPTIPDQDTECYALPVLVSTYSAISWYRFIQ